MLGARNVPVRHTSAAWGDHYARPSQCTLHNAALTAAWRAFMADALDSEPLSVVQFDANADVDECVFPRISSESHWLPAQRRWAAFEHCWATAFVRLTGLTWELYEPLLSSLRARAREVDGHEDGVPTVAVDASGSAKHASFDILLQDAIDDAILVNLTPSQCTNVASGLAAFVAQTVSEGEKLWTARLRERVSDDGAFQAQLEERRAFVEAIYKRYESGDIALLCAWYAASFGGEASVARRPVIVLLVHGVERFGAGAFNDVLQAIILAARGDATDLLGDADAPTQLPLLLCLVYMAATPAVPRAASSSAWLTSAVAPGVRSQMAVTGMSLPDKAAFWEHVVCAFVIEPHTRVWFGRGVFEMLRRRFWHIEASFESVAQLVKVRCPRAVWAHSSSRMCATSLSGHFQHSCMIRRASVSSAWRGRRSCVRSCGSRCSGLT